MKAWSSLLGPLGLVAIVFAMLSAILFVASPVATGDELVWIFGNLGLGVLLLGLWASTGWSGIRQRLSSGEARRAGKYGTAALLSTLLGIVILALLAFLVVRHPKRFDWSEAAVHSLSDQTKKVISGLGSDVTVTALVPALDQPPVRDLLERYAYESPRLHVEYADPTARPDLVEKFGVAAEKIGHGIVRVEIGAESVEVTEFDENRLTNAFVKLTRTGQKKVYFVQGHGEHPVEGDAAKAPDGLQQAMEALKNESYEVAPLLLATQSGVPQDADVVVLAGTSRPLPPAEREALEKWLGAGGALAVLLDPNGRSELEPLLATWGVDAGADVIVDRVLAMFGRATTPFSESYGAHPIVKDLRERTLFHVARSMRPNDAGKGRFSELVSTGAESWGERDLKRFLEQGEAELDPVQDLKGPVPLAVAGNPAGMSAPAAAPDAAADAAKPREPRLVVFGDSDFATNQMMDAYRNRDLFVNSVNWLLGDVEAISIRPNQSRASRLRQLSAEEFFRIRFLSLFVLPEAIAFAGVYAWWSRRRAPGR